MKITKDKASGKKTPRGRATGHAPNGKLNRGTAKEFEREDMGIAPKE